eukprot:90598_1
MGADFPTSCIPRDNDTISIGDNERRSISSLEGTPTTYNKIQQESQRSTSDDRIDKPAPDFDCVALMPNQTFENIKLSNLKGKWVVLFFYPMDFTFVCPTEICEFSDKSTDFDKINCRVIGASVDSQYAHFAWSNVPRNQGGIGQLNIPLLADVSRTLSTDYGVLLEEGHTCRATFIIDPNGVVRHMQMNDPPVGRNIDEILRLVQGYQFADENGSVCPAKWKSQNDPTIKPDPEGKLEYFEAVYGMSSHEMV